MLTAYILLFSALLVLCAGDDEPYVPCPGKVDEANWDRLSEVIPDFAHCGYVYKNLQSTFSQNNPDLHYANLGEFPSAVRIRTEISHNDKDGKVFWTYRMCNGVLVTEQHVVTVASCLQDPPVPRLNFTGRIIKVTVGDYNTEVSTRDCVTNDVNTTCAPPATTILVNRSVPHEHFNRFSLRHDIAVLELNQPVQLSDYVQPICLPYECSSRADPYRRFKDPLMMVGWRIYWTNRNTTAPPSTLQKLQVEYRMPGHVLYGCNETYHWIDNATQMCIFKKPTDPKEIVNCDAYSGGFLVSNPDVTQHDVLGLVSYGESCESGRTLWTGDPIVVTWIPVYIRWIMKTIYYLRRGHHFPYTFSVLEYSTGVEGD